MSLLLKKELTLCMDAVAVMLENASMEICGKSCYVELYEEGERILDGIDKGNDISYSELHDVIAKTNGKKTPETRQDSRVSLAIAIYMITEARRLAREGDYRWALWFFTNACVGAGAATDRLIEAEARSSSSKKAQEASIKPKKERDEIIKNELAKLTQGDLKKTKNAARIIENSDAYAELPVKISPDQLLDLIREVKKPN